MPHKPRFVALTQRVRQIYPHLGDPARAISDRLVRVDGVIVTNPRSRISRAAAVTVASPPAPPRGARKLTVGLDAFAVPVAGRIALDIGASTGGFTHALLAAGARRVYAVLAVDPQAARRRRRDTEKCARVDCWPEPYGTASLAGWHLPSVQALAADKRLCQIAAAWRKQGAAGETDLLRARAYLALLLDLPIDAPPADLLPPADPPVPGGPAPEPTPSDTTVGPGSTGPASAARPGAGEAGSPGNPGLPDGLRRAGPGSALPPLAGTVNLTVPLTTLLGLDQAPGQAAGYGPLEADTARALACAAAGHRATRWQITVTAPDGTALAHGTAARRSGVNSPKPGDLGPGDPGPGDPGPGGTGAGGWTVAVTAEPVATGSCDHRHCEPGYRPSPALQRLIRARSSTCTAPGCRRPAAACDLDHTRAYDDDGWTCECNLAPLCRRHHRAKQAQGWRLTQPQPGVLIWTTPSGRVYPTQPANYH